MPDSLVPRQLPDLIARIPLSARRILAVGVENDRLRQAFAARAPSCRWSTLEVGDQGSLASQPSVDWRGRFDTLVFDNALERLRDPASALASLMPCLAAGGVVVACGANVGHWTTVRGLLKGEFRYGTGVLGNDHLRLMTAETMAGLFQQVGLRVEKFVPSGDSPDDAEYQRFCAAAQPLLTALGQDQRALKALATTHCILVGRRQAETVRPCLHLVHYLTPRFSEMRKALPLAAIDSLPDAQVSYCDQTLVLPRLPNGSPRLVIMPRHLPDADNWSRMLDQIHALGWAVITDWDDHPDLFIPRVRAQFDLAPWASVKSSDAVQTSTEPLATVIRQVRGDDQVVVLDNRLLELPPLPERSAGKVRIFFGAFNRERQAAELAPMLDPILAQFPDVELVVVYERTLFESLTAPNKVFFPALPYADYLRLLGSCRIALLPLGDSLGEQCKSDVKFIEAGSLGVACIASPSVYAASLRHGATGLLAATPEAFGTALRHLLAHPEDCDRLGRAARDYVASERMLADTVLARVEWYRRFWERFTNARTGTHPPS